MAKQYKQTFSFDICRECFHTWDDHVEMEDEVTGEEFYPCCYIGCDCKEFKLAQEA